MRVTRRRIRIVTRANEARAVIEDDFHHFRIDVRHADGIISGVSSDAIRHPWSGCPLAGLQLKRLAGMPLSPSVGRLMEYVDARAQCTHMFDLAALAIAAAARGIKQRIYDIAVPERIDGHTEAALLRDGERILSWSLQGSLIVAPAPFVGVDLRRGFARWVAEHLNIDAAEAALVLRRGVFISGDGPRVDLDTLSQPYATGGCFVTQPQRSSSFRRMVGSTYDFSDRPQALTSDDDRWLSVADAFGALDATET